MTTGADRRSRGRWPRLPGPAAPVALGIFVAIPAVVFFNVIEKLATDLIAEVEASALEWTALIAERPRTATLPAIVPTVSLRPGARAVHAVAAECVKRAGRRLLSAWT